jgi:hypothetical protein
MAAPYSISKECPQLKTTAVVDYKTIVVIVYNDVHNVQDLLFVVIFHDV